MIWKSSNFHSIFLEPGGLPDFSFLRLASLKEGREILYVYLMFFHDMTNKTHSLIKDKKVCLDFHFLFRKCLLDYHVTKIPFV